MKNLTIKQRILYLCEQLFEVKKIKIVIGKDKKPIDAEDTIIFHVDF